MWCQHHSGRPITLEIASTWRGHKKYGRSFHQRDDSDQNTRWNTQHMVTHGVRNGSSSDTHTHTHTTRFRGIDGDTRWQSNAIAEYCHFQAHWVLVGQIDALATCPKWCGHTHCQLVWGAKEMDLFGEHIHWFRGYTFATCLGCETVWGNWCGLHTTAGRGIGSGCGHEGWF